MILHDLEKHTRVQCGYATLHDVNNLTDKEDRMESFFLSETLKYLYLLFDVENILHSSQYEHVFSTQGHFFFLSRPITRNKKHQKPSFSAPPKRKANCPILSWKYYLLPYEVRVSWKALANSMGLK